MTWQAQFPESVRVLDRWLCDVTVFNGVEKFVVSVSYDHSIEECLPQLRAAVAKRDAQTLKPADPIAPGTVVDLTPPAPVEPPKPDDPPPATQDEIDRAKWVADYLAELTQLRLATLSPDLAARYKPEYGGLR